MVDPSSTPPSALPVSVENVPGTPRHPPTMTTPVRGPWTSERSPGTLSCLSLPQVGSGGWVELGHGR